MYRKKTYTAAVDYLPNSSTPTPVPLEDRTVWPRYDMDEMAILHLSKSIKETIYDYEQQTYAFWKEYMKYLLHGIETV